METIPIKQTDLRLPYIKGSLEARIYEPVRADIKGAVNVGMGIGGAIDDGASHKLAIPLAELGFYVMLYNAPSHGVNSARSSDGEFTLENCLDATDAVYRELRKRFGNVFVITHSYGAYPVMRSIKERKNDYSAVSVINPMLSFVDVYNEYPIGRVYMDMYEAIRNDPTLREGFCRIFTATLNLIATKQSMPFQKLLRWLFEDKNMLKLFTQMSCLRFDRTDRLAELTIYPPALYESIEKLETPVQVFHCVNDGILFTEPMDEERERDLREKWNKIIVPEKLEFNLYGEIDTKKGPDHLFRKDGEPFEAKEFREIMHKIAEFFLKHLN